MRRTLLFSLTLSLVLGGRAAAQACVGMPSFSTGQMQLSGGGSFTDGASSFGGNFGYGVPRGLYGKAGIGSTSYDGLSGSSFDFNAGGGYQIPLHASQPAEICPVASLSLGSGPNNIAGTDFSSRTFLFGASAGMQVGHSTQVTIVPNAAFQFANTRVTANDGATSTSASDGYALFTVGTGFIFSSRFSVNPSLSFPMGLQGGNTTFGLVGAMNFGH